MALIPPTLTDLATSKKAVTLWVIIALWMPAVHSSLGLTENGLMWISVAFCAYVLSQGIADLGNALAGKRGCTK